MGDLPATRFQDQITQSRVVDAVKFDFAHFRTIKNAAAGASINDAALTIVGGALRKYLTSKHELPDQSLVTGCPVDIREDGEKDSGGNMVGLMNVALRTDIEDPLQRLQAVQRESRSAKAQFTAMGSRTSMNVLNTVPGRHHVAGGQGRYRSWADRVNRAE